MKATLVETKHQELAEAGDHVGGDDGELYRVVRWIGSMYIENGNRCIRAEVEPASWDDVDDGWEQGCRAILAD